MKGNENAPLLYPSTPPRNNGAMRNAASFGSASDESPRPIYYYDNHNNSNTQINSPFGDSPSKEYLSDSDPLKEDANVSVNGEAHAEVDYDSLTSTQKFVFGAKGAYRFLGDSFNLMNDILAAGSVGLPFYVAECGFGVAMILFIIFAIVTDYTLTRLFFIAQKYKQKSLPELSRFGLGKLGYAAACFFIFCYNYGALCANMIIVSTTVPPILTHIFGQSYFYLSRQYVLLYVTAICLPLTFFRKLTSFAILSIISVITIIGIAIIVVTRGAVELARRTDLPPSDAWAFSHASMLQALGGMCYIYVCHDLSFSVVEDLKNPTQKRWNKIVHFCLAITAISVMAYGGVGYTLFWSDTKANILDNFSDTDMLITIARGALAFSVGLGLPFSCFMPRFSINAMITLFYPNIEAKYPRLWSAWHYILTILVIGSALAISEVVTDLGTVFELVGGFSACSIGYILPPLLYLKLEPGTWYRTPHKFAMLVVLIMGMFVCITSTLTTILDVFNVYMG